MGMWASFYFEDCKGQRKIKLITFDFEHNYFDVLNFESCLNKFIYMRI